MDAESIAVLEAVMKVVYAAGADSAKKLEMNAENVALAEVVMKVGMVIENG